MLGCAKAIACILDAHSNDTLSIHMRDCSCTCRHTAFEFAGQAPMHRAACGMVLNMNCNLEGLGQSPTRCACLARVRVRAACTSRSRGPRGGYRGANSSVFCSMVDSFGALHLLLPCKRLRCVHTVACFPLVRLRHCGELQLLLLRFSKSPRPHQSWQGYKSLSHRVGRQKTLRCSPNVDSNDALSTHKRACLA